MPHKRAKRSVREAETAKRGSNLAPSSSSKIDDAPRSAMRILNSLSTQAAFRAKGRTSSEDTGERRKKPLPKSTSSSSALKSPAHGETSTKSNSKRTDPKKSAQDGKPKIMPHESLADFNRRVESTLRGGVSQAIKSAAQSKTAQTNAVKSAKEQRKLASKLPPSSTPSSTTNGNVEKKGVKRKHDASDAAIEFASVPGPRRLNDIAQAPPSLPKLKVARDETVSVWASKGKGKSGLSAGQERLMEVERERVIKRYREMKAAKEELREKERVEEAKVKAKGKGGVKSKGKGGGEVKRVKEYTSDDE